MPEITTAERDGVGMDGRTRPSEDRVAVLDDAVILLDGATETRRPAPPVTVPEYVDALLAALRESLETRPCPDLADTLGSAVATVAERFDLRAGRAPSSTVAMLRWTAERVDTLVLGDSPAVLLTGDAPTVVADTRLAELSAAGKLRTEHDVAELRNADGGFWVAEADATAAHRAVRVSVPRSDVRAGLLASDGVSCGVDRYRLFGWSEVFECCTGEGPEAVLERVRDAERADADCARWPRSKVHDDQALAVVRFW